jgi:hypothetical protein
MYSVMRDATVATSFADFDKILDEFADESVAFRGHSDSGWRLQSKFDRLVKQVISPSVKQKEQSASRFEEHFAFFKELILGQLDVGELTDWQIESLGQHHGLATRFLDWSLSPYVALFFAMTDMKGDKNPSIWALDIDLPNGQRDHEPTSNELKLLRPSFHKNSRIVAQQGLFTLLVGGGALEALSDKQLETMSAGSCKSLKKIELKFSKPEWESCRIRLGRMGITSSSLYPDVFGMALAANQRSERRKSIMIAPEPIPIRTRSLEGAVAYRMSNKHREALAQAVDNMMRLGVGSTMPNLADGFIEQAKQSSTAREALAKLAGVDWRSLQQRYDTSEDTDVTSAVERSTEE